MNNNVIEVTDRNVLDGILKVVLALAQKLTNEKVILPLEIGNPSDNGYVLIEGDALRPVIWTKQDSHQV